jgi:AmiR/NasT family two-component response regulator
MGVTADAWYQHSTRRIDAMKTMEDRMASDLARLCAVKLAEVRDNLDVQTNSTDAIGTTAPVAILLTDVDPALNPLGLGAGVSLYTLAGAQPKPIRSILDVIQAQSRYIHDVSSRLESARVALIERKVIERAKGLLMNSRRLSEKDAYALMRESAMSQNKRIVEIAESIVSMAQMLNR